MVVSWRTVRCRTAAPYADAQFRIISKFALNISTMGSGFIKGTLENGIVSFGFGYHDFLLAWQNAAHCVTLLTDSFMVSSKDLAYSIMDM